MRVKTEEKRQAIIDIASKAFMNKGFSETTMSYISTQLGGSKATLYNYFNSKEDIFHAVMQSRTAEQMRIAFERLSQTKDFQKGLYDFACHYLRTVLTPEVASIRKMARAEAGRSNIGRLYYDNGPRLGLQRLAHVLQQHVDRGLLRIGNTDVAAKQFKALLDAELLEIYDLMVIDRPSQEEIHQVAKRAIDSFLCIYGQ